MSKTLAFANTREGGIDTGHDGDRQTPGAVRTAEQGHSTRTLQRAIGNAQVCRVLRMTTPGSAMTSAAGGVAGNGADNAECAEQQSAVQRYPVQASGPSHLPPSVTHAIQGGGGERLPDANRAHMESALGADLSGVRIHRDPDAAHAAHDISARAFTVGQDIYFGAGQYDPGTKQGNRLLAHELTHTVQQGSGTVTAQADTPISSPADPLEREAEAVAASIGHPSPHQPPRPRLSAAHVQRKPAARTLTHEASIQRQPVATVLTTEGLTSPRLAGNARLRQAFRNRPPVVFGERGEAVARIQQTLLDDGLELPVSTRRTGLPDGIFGEETEGAVKAFQRKHRIGDDGRVGHDTLIELDKVASAPTPREQPLAPPLAPGEEHREWTVEQYTGMWEKKHKRKMTTEERETLARGCIGITALNLGRGNINPPLGLSFSTFGKARSVAAELNRILQAKPALDQLPAEISGSTELKDLKNVLAEFPIDADPTKWRAIIFSKRFYSNQDPDPEKRKAADPNAFLPDPRTGQVDMSGYRYEARPGYVNFDYGWYDEETNSWWHANHAEPGMQVYQSTLEYYSRPLLDFDRQVFSVAFARIDK
jgi:peptidoglycan hydrolase-like protein with peptidoglycan-binding domain